MPPSAHQTTKHLSLSAMGIDTIPNTVVGIDTHTKTDNVYLIRFFPVAKEMVQLVTNQRAITIMTTAKLPLPLRQLRTAATEEKALRIGKLMPIRDLRSGSGGGGSIELLYCGKMRERRGIWSKIQV